MQFAGAVLQGAAPTRVEGARVQSPKVFISYCHEHDTLDMGAAAKGLADRLLDDGLDVTIDTYLERKPPNWPAWMYREVTNNDYVVVVCTAEYRRRAETTHGSGTGWESLLITDAIYHDQSEAGSRFIPVTLGEDRDDVVPYFLRQTTSFDVTSDVDYEGLVRTLFDVPLVVRPPIGEPPEYIREAMTGVAAPAVEAIAALPMTVGKRWDKHRELFLATSSGLQHSWSDDPESNWSPWEPMATPGGRVPIVDLASGAFPVVGGKRSTLHLYALMEGGQVLESSIAPLRGVWGQWEEIGSCPDAVALSATSIRPGHQEIFALVGDGTIVHKWRRHHGDVWSPWTPMPLPDSSQALAISTTAVEAYPGASETCQWVIVATHSGLLWQRIYDGNAKWSMWSRIHPSGRKVRSLAANAGTDSTLLFALDFQGNVLVRSFLGPGEEPSSEWRRVDLDLPGPFLEIESGRCALGDDSGAQLMLASRTSVARSQVDAPWAPWSLQWDRSS